MKFTFSEWIAEHFTRSTRDKLSCGIPTIKFDKRLVTKSVRDDLWENVQMIDDIPRSFHKRLYNAALQSILRGGDLHLLTNAILEMRINSIDKKRAGSIATLLSNKAKSLINNERQSREW